MSIQYRLPLTVARITGTVATTTNPLSTESKRTSTTTSASVEMVVRADPKSRHVLQIEARDWARLKTTINLLPDGRVVGASGEFENHSGDRWKAAFSSAAATASTLSPLLATGAPGIAAVAAAAIGVGALTALSEGLEASFLTADMLPKGDQATGEPDQPDNASLGIEGKYQKEHQDEAASLAKYRWALQLLQARHAEVATRTLMGADAQARTLRSIERSITSTKRVAAGGELVYARWVAAQSTTTVEPFFEELRIDELPTVEHMRSAIADPSGVTARWWVIAQKTRAVATCDFEPSGLHPDRPAQELEVSVPDGWIKYRSPCPAVITYWKLSGPHEASGEGTSAYEVECETVQRVLVTAPGSEHIIAVVSSGGDDRSLTVAFDPSGALTQLTSDDTSASVGHAATIMGLPSVVSDAVTTGQAVAAPFIPATPLARAKDDLELAQTMKALNDLRNPAPSDPLDPLRANVAKAELAARLAAATQAIHDPSSTHVSIQVTT